MSKRQPVAIETAKPRIHGNLSPEQINALISNKCIVKPQKFNKNRGSYVFFVPHAWDSLKTSICYSKWVPENELESQYFLEGYYFIDFRGVSSTVITNVITPYSASQGKSSAQLYSEENNVYAFIQQKESELIKFSSKGKVNSTGAETNPFFQQFGAPIRVGFGHTHPNIGVFLSAVDKTSIFAIEGEPWVTMVADPRREQLLTVVGPQMKSAEIVIYQEAEVTQQAKPEPRREIAPKEYENIDNFVEFFKYFNAQINSGCSSKFKIKGKLPGKLKFKGSFYAPRTKKPKSSRKKR